MKTHSIRHFFTNIICGMIPGAHRRKAVRVILNSDMRQYIRFIRSDINGPVRKIHTMVGHRGNNLLISVNDEYIYKFPCRHVDICNYRAMRESRITGALCGGLNIHIPKMELLQCNDIYVRKYEYVHGRGLAQFPTQTIMTHCTEYGTQIGRFVFDMATRNPADIADLKTTRYDGSASNITDDATPGFMYGWYHNDLEDNIIIDPHTMQIVAIIDWEDACFMDFANAFAPRHDGPWREIMRIARAEYVRLYNQKFKTKMS